MITKIKKWGNSQGLRFPKEILRKAGVKTGDEVDVSIGKNAIYIKPLRRQRGRYKLKELLSEIRPDDIQVETEWGKPEGKEVW